MEHKNVPQHIGSFGIYDQSTAPGGKVRFKSVIRHFEHQIKKSMESVVEYFLELGEG